MSSDRIPENAARRQQMHGIVVLDKPCGPTSSQCLAAFKRQGQRKVGHAGTLDPMASGVLPVLLGHATKLSSFLMREGRKIYTGAVRLGVETDTWDMEGQIVAEGSTAGITAAAVAAAMAAWTEITVQEAPAFSALKHNGQPLYKLARKGLETPVKIRQVRIYEAGMSAFDMPFASFRVTCGSGAYIRSLAHSLGRRLGCGAALCRLRREYSHPFDIGQATPLAEIKAGLGFGHVLPLTAALPGWPRIGLTAAQALAVRNGMPVAAALRGADFAFLCQGEQPLAIGRLAADKAGRPVWAVERGLWD